MIFINMDAKYNKTTISLAIPAILSEQTTTPDKRISAKTKKLSNTKLHSLFFKYLGLYLCEKNT